MRSFRQFFEEDEDWSQEEIMAHIQAANAQLKPPFEPPEYVDPDDFYNRGGVFAFTYSDRMVKRPGTSEYAPEGLEIAEPGLKHSYMIRKNTANYRDSSPILSGRYGVKDGAPIVAIWGSPVQSLLKPALKAIWYRKLIHPDSFLFLYDGIKGLVRDQLKPKIPASKRAEAEQSVEIGQRSYQLYELPGLLHSLPAMSQERTAIAAFICDNYEKYPILKNFLAKAGCRNQQPSTPRQIKEPEWVRRRQQWPTSENRE